jgi:hypothetical protein
MARDGLTTEGTEIREAIALLHEEFFSVPSVASVVKKHFRVCAVV